MVASEIDTKLQTLRTSLKQLNSITQAAYNENICQIALNKWKKDLSPDNPQWQFLSIKSFAAADKGGSAHAMAMIDKRLPGKGLIGYFACTRSDIGAETLNQACDWLKAQKGISDVYGPINGTLPNDYRLNLDDDYVFPGEPVNPKWHIEAFHEAGFTAFNEYASGKLKHFSFWLKFTLRKRNTQGGRYGVRAFDGEDHAADFKKYHDLRNRIFPLQSTYCPAISLAERAYNSDGKFNPEYTYFLSDNGIEIGFIMAYVYDNQLILKTIGLLPEYGGRGLSKLLLRPVHDQAAREGITTAIYGMVRVGNKVYREKHPMAREFRKYATMHRSIMR